MAKSSKKRYDFIDHMLRDCDADAVSLYDLYGHSEENTSISALDFQILSWATDLLCTSPTARTMLRDACDRGWSVTLEEDLGHDYCLYAEEKIIALSKANISSPLILKTAHYRNSVLLHFVRALRDVWHEERMDAFEVNYNIETVLFLERMRNADIDVMAVYVAWELRSEHNCEIWHHMIGSDLGDMAMTYSTYLERDPTAHFTGAALKMCFSAWYSHDVRVNKCDHDTLCYMDDMIAEQGLEQAFGGQNASVLDVEMISCLPNKTAYLRGRGDELLSDPYYYGVDDEINQAHFLQIAQDQKVIRVCDVPFRSADLARRIFPEEI